MINFQKRYFIETLKNNEPNFDHKHHSNMNSILFQNHLYEESALFRFEVLSKPIYKCNEDRPYYATHYHFFQYLEGFNFITGKVTAEFKDVHLNIPQMEHLLSHHTLNQTSAMDILFQKNQLYTTNLRTMNFSENKTGLVLYIQMYKQMLNSTKLLAKSHLK